MTHNTETKWSVSEVSSVSSMNEEFIHTQGNSLFDVYGDLTTKGIYEWNLHQMGTVRLQSTD